LSSLQDIKAATQIPDSDLLRSLQSLACAKFKILTKNPKSRDVGPSDKFSFNNSFTCPLAKIKIQTIVGKVENNEERAETQEKVDEERKHQIEVSSGLSRACKMLTGTYDPGLHRPHHERQEELGT
jgi:cullin 3